MDISDFSTDPCPDAKNARWRQDMAAFLLRDELAQHLIDLLRDEFDLTDPLTREELQANHAPQRSEVRARIVEIATETVWTGWLTFLNYILRPDEFAEDFLPADEDTGEAITPEQTQAIGVAIRAIPKAFVEQGFQALFADLFIDLFTDYAIHGDLVPPRPLPEYFSYTVFDLPLAEDTFLIAAVTRSADIDHACKLLKDKYRELYVPGERDRSPANPTRDAWVLREYHTIKEGLADKQASIEYMADILDVEDEDAMERTALDELLALFAETEWHADLSGHDLTSKAGRRAAKNFLKQIVHRERRRAQALEGTLRPRPPEP